MATINVNEAYILNETGAEVDKVTGLFTKDENTTDAEKSMAQLNIGGGGGGRNLLDNPFFTVRQRGDGPFTGNVYGVDRWRGSNSRTTVAGNSGYITLSTNSSGNGILRQILPQTYEGTYTLSAVVKGSGSGAIFFQDSGGTAIGDTIDFTVSGSEQIITNTFTTSGTAIGGVGIRVNTSNSIDVVAVKLELGTVSTLANDVPPNYAEELAKCKYYFERIGVVTGSYSFMGSGTATSATNASVILPCSPKRNATLTVTSSGSFRVLDTSAHAVSDIAKQGSMATNCVMVSVTTTGLTTGGAVLFGANNSTTVYIDISADL